MEKLEHLCVGACGSPTHQASAVGSVAGLPTLTSAPGGGARRGSLSGWDRVQLQLEDTGTWREARQRDPWPPAPRPLQAATSQGDTRRATAGPQIPREASSILGACRAPGPPSKQLQQPLQRQRTSKPPA